MSERVSTSESEGTVHKSFFDIHPFTNKIYGAILNISGGALVFNSAGLLISSVKNDSLSQLAVAAISTAFGGMIMMIAYRFNEAAYKVEIAKESEKSTSST